MNCRVLALLYGDFDTLHYRLLDSFRQSIPLDVPITLWLNQVGARSKARIAAENERYDVVDSRDNVHKYVAMRALMRRHEGSSSMSFRSRLLDLQSRRAKQRE